MADASGQEPALPAFLRRLRAIDRAIQRVEVSVCVAALATMVVLAFLQVFLRQFRGVGIGPLTIPQPVAWFDNVARHLVIWVGLLGASLATAEGRHISIEAVPKLLGPKGRRRVEVLTSAAALAVVLVLLALCSIYMLRLQMPNEAHLFEVESLGLTVYRWPLLVIVPIGLLLMAWRFLLRIIEGVSLDDDAFAALRREVIQNDVETIEGAQEDQEVDLLVESAERMAAGGHGDTIDRAGARTEVRKALKSDRFLKADVAARRAAAEQCPRCGKSTSGDVRQGCPKCEAVHHATCWDRGDGCGVCGERRRRESKREASLRSTDEIPVYRDLSEQEDALEPELRRGITLPAPPGLESEGELDALIDDAAEAAVESVADTARLQLGAAIPADDDAVEADLRTPATERLRNDPPPDSVVVIVKPKDEDSEARS